MNSGFGEACQIRCEWICMNIFPLEVDSRMCMCVFNRACAHTATAEGKLGH